MEMFNKSLVTVAGFDVKVWMVAAVIVAVIAFKAFKK